MYVCKIYIYIYIYIYIHTHTVCSKSIKIEAVFTKTEMNKNEMLIIFRIVSMAFNALIPGNFPLAEAIFETSPLI